MISRIRRGAVALALLGPLLGACSSPSLPSFSSMFGSGTPAGDANAAAPLALPNDFECPSVQVRSGAATLTSSADPNDAERDQPALSGRAQHHGPRMPPGRPRRGRHQGRPPGPGDPRAARASRARSTCRSVTP